MESVAEKLPCDTQHVNSWLKATKGTETNHYVIAVLQMVDC